MTFIERDCPLCGADPSRSTLEVKAATPAEEQSENSLTEYFMGFRAGQCFFSYHRCADCGLLWCPVYLSDDFLSTLYSNMPPNLAVSGERDSHRTQMGYARIIEARQSGNLKIMEIGSDIGLVMRSLMDKTSVARIIAVEPNLSVHSLLMKNTNHQAEIHTRIDQVPLGSDINLVVAVHVLDHLLSPSKTLAKITESVRVDQEIELFSVVHDEKSFLRLLLKRRWAPFCLQHPQLFNARTLGELYRRQGFDNLAWGKTTNWLALSQIISLGNQIGILPSFLTHLVPKMSVPLKLGNIYFTGNRVI